MDCLLGSLEGGEFASHEAELGETLTNFLKLEKKNYFLSALHMHTHTREYEQAYSHTPETGKC